MVEALLISAIGALVLLLATAMWDRASRSGAIKNAVDTITILQAQVVAYKDDNAALRVEVAKLKVAMDALHDMVTAAAPIEKLTMKVENMDRQISEALGRIEGYVHTNQRNRDLETNTQ